mmetsp:Transcript_6930/g.20018  ORF Transcript_6930/g.20018 Transcript_6930/m.20018 type:complete len:162 (-) Transcript_6930:263-748(-)
MAWSYATKRLQPNLSPPCFNGRSDVTGCYDFRALVHVHSSSFFPCKYENPNGLISGKGWTATGRLRTHSGGILVVEYPPGLRVDGIAHELLNLLLRQLVAAQSEELPERLRIQVALALGVDRAKGLLQHLLRVAWIAPAQDQAAHNPFPSLVRQRGFPTML